MDGYVPAALRKLLRKPVAPIAGPQDMRLCRPEPKRIYLGQQ